MLKIEKLTKAQKEEDQFSEEINIENKSLIKSIKFDLGEKQVEENEFRHYFQTYEELMMEKDPSDIENRIYEWMKAEGIYQFDPASLQEDYFNNKRLELFAKFSNNSEISDAATTTSYNIDHNFNTGENRNSNEEDNYQNFIMNLQKKSHSVKKISLDQKFFGVADFNEIEDKKELCMSKMSHSDIQKVQSSNNSPLRKKTEDQTQQKTSLFLSLNIQQNRLLKKRSSTIALVKKEECL